MHRGIVESRLFSEQLNQLGDIVRMDEALCGLYSAISTQSALFPVAHQDWDEVRLARTRSVKSTVGVTPMFRIWSRILDDSRTELLWVEAEDELDEL